MHPSRAIHGRTTRLLEGRRIVVGVSGSIAAVEVPRIVRELIRHGADVRAVMSPEATRIVTEEALEFATGHPPVVRLSGQVEHVSLLGPGEGQADLLLVAPATANTISKIAHGIDDTPVTSCASVALGGHVPVLLVPAMHSLMGENPAIVENLRTLTRWGVRVLFGPRAEGEAKIATPEEVAAEVLHLLARGPWAQRELVVVGGAGRAPLDDVRSVTNHSSGATAVALAVQGHYRGATVELWAGGMEVPIPPWLSVERWGTVEELMRLVRRRGGVLRRAAAVLVPAALPDYSVARHAGKIRAAEAPRLTVTLARGPRLLPVLRRAAPTPARLVAFKLLAEDDPESLEREGRRLVDEEGADWVVANSVGNMGGSRARILVVPSRGGRWWIQGDKAEVAGKLLDDLGRDLAETRVGGTVRRRPTPRSRGAVRSGSPRSRPGTRARSRRR